MPKIAVIGCGRWGKNLIRNFASLGALARVCGDLPAQSAEIAQEFGVSASSYPDILKDASIAGVVIATPAHSHATLVEEALSAGKHVYVEKPITLSLEQAQRITDLATQHNRVLMTGHLLQYHPVFLKLQTLLNDGMIGDLRKIHTHRLFMGRIRQSENVMWDLLPHDISMVLTLAKEDPTTVQACASATFGKCHDTVQATLTFPSGITAYLSAAWTFPIKTQRLILIGTSGALIFDDTLSWDQKLTHIPFTLHSQDHDILVTAAQGSPVRVEPDEPLKLECQHFLDCMADKRLPLTGPQEFLPVMKVCQQIHDIIGD